MAEFAGFSKVQSIAALALIKCRFDLDKIEKQLDDPQERLNLTDVEIKAFEEHREYLQNKYARYEIHFRDVCDDIGLSDSEEDEAYAESLIESPSSDAEYQEED